MSTGVRVKGLKETIRSLERLGVSVEDLKGAMSNVSSKVVSDAKALTPVRSGALQASIRASKAKNKATMRGGSAKVYYASFVEYGSVHNKAQQMVTDAVTANQDYMVTQLEREVESLIARYNLN